VNYAFILIDAQGRCTPDDAAAAAVSFPELQALKTQFPHLQVLLAVGGWGQAEAFAQAAAMPESRRQLAASCVALVQTYGFDGLDIDWEYPAPEAVSTFVALLAELRQQLAAVSAAEGRPLLLTMAAGASPYQYNDLNWAEVVPLLDWVNLMTYDYHGPWSGLTGFNAPLYPSPDDQAASALERQTFNVSTAVQALLGLGVPPAQLVVGVPFFGRGWAGVPDVNHGLYQPFSGPPNGQASFDYSELAAHYLVPDSGYAQHWSESAQVPWLFNPTTGVMISYDDARSLGLKASYVRSHGLGGVMIWQLGGDDDQGTLLHALSEHLK
jgi:chitinase